MGKQDSRQQKKLAKSLKQKEKSIRLVSAFIDSNIDSSPKIKCLPDVEKRPNVDAQLGSLSVPKQAKVVHDGSRFGFLMTWCARHADNIGNWPWGEARLWGDQEWEDTILTGLNSYEGLDWKEIHSMNSDTGHLMHHDHDISDLCNEAVDRWLELNLDQFEVVFRFRLGNKKRAWGIELQGHFYLIWYERDHKIYPVG